MLRTFYLHLGRVHVFCKVESEKLKVESWRSTFNYLLFTFDCSSCDPVLETKSKKSIVAARCCFKIDPFIPMSSTRMSSVPRASARVRAPGRQRVDLQPPKCRMTAATAMLFVPSPKDVPAKRARRASLVAFDPWFGEHSKIENWSEV